VSIFVRPALAEDAVDIRSILQSSFGEYQTLLKLAEPPAALAESIEDVEAAINSQTVFIAIYNRMKPVGTIRVRKVNQDIAYISRFAVVPNWQQSGAGSALMEAAVDFCRAQGIRAIVLHTAVKMIPLARFYHGCGFYVHSVEVTHAGYRRGLFIKELEDCSDIEFENLQV
jgi:ribosomal protein S18 acetylase RimI-like enzyme